jgi:apolipoprotein D and lipocalin family protein
MKYVMSPILSTLVVAVAAAAAGCATTHREPIAAVKQVDLDRFMGPWYVIASIPTFWEKNAYNAVESYERNPDGTIKTTFTFHKASADGPLKTMRPTGYVRDASNATWGMQFLWPIKAEYLIAHLDEDYSETIIARTARDYVWVMARKPSISDDDYQRLLTKVAALGYDTGKVIRVPQAWPGKG